MIEISNDDEIYGVLLHEQMKLQNVDELIKMLYCNDNELKKRTIRRVHHTLHLEILMHMKV